MEGLSSQKARVIWTVTSQGGTKNEKLVNRSNWELNIVPDSMPELEVSATERALDRGLDGTLANPAQVSLTCSPRLSLCGPAAPYDEVTTVTRIDAQHPKVHDTTALDWVCLGEESKRASP